MSNTELVLSIFAVVLLISLFYYVVRMERENEDE
jgi:hypothetical protein